MRGIGYLSSLYKQLDSELIRYVQANRFIMHVCMRMYVRLITTAYETEALNNGYMARHAHLVVLGCKCRDACTCVACACMRMQMPAGSIQVSNSSAIVQCSVRACACSDLQAFEQRMIASHT